MSKTPSISVVMPAYNAERFIDEAIRSILDQTFEDFEFIIINDGSKDKTEEIILSHPDPRIIYLKNDGNKGLSYSFNKGVSAAQGKYIARMDADDISLPDRFAKQYSYLESHPKIGILGSSMIEIDENGKKKHLLKRDSTHVEIKWSSLFSTPLYHPTIMARAEVLKSHHYNEGLSNSEDYELWSRLLFNTQVIFANIKRPLFLYRSYPTSFTQSINLDKRVISAHNTIGNIGHYLTLTPEEKRLIVLLRQERKIKPVGLWKIYWLYLRAVFKFIKKEKPLFLEIPKILLRIAKFKVFLLKHHVKHH